MADAQRPTAAVCPAAASHPLSSSFYPSCCSFGFFILQFLAGALDVADDESKYW